MDKPPCDREDALAVVRRLRENGHVAYFAGGCVRDALLGLNPKDYDVATDAAPPRVRELFKRTQAVGAAFGVILVKQGRSTVEVATFRSDGRYLDGRRPEGVTFTTAEEDARRRDFTINGLFLDPLADRVIDFVGGQDDLKAKRLRAIGDPAQRFEEDHLRLLRAVRFAARFGLKIEPVTAEAIRRSAPRLKGISPERIAEELRMMLTPPITRNIAWRLLWEFRLIQVIFRTLPEQPTAMPAVSVFEKLSGTRDERREMRDEAQSSSLVSHLSSAAPPPQPSPGVPEEGVGSRVDFGVALAAAVLSYRAGSGVPLAMLSGGEIRRMQQAVRTTLRISNEELDTMGGAMDIAALLADAPPTVAVMKRFLARPTSGGSRIILDALHDAGQHQERVIWLRERLAEFEKTDYAPPPLLTGDDLTAAGWKPGPVFKQVLDQVYDAQLEGRVGTKEEAIEMAKCLIPSGVEETEKTERRQTGMSTPPQTGMSVPPNGPNDVGA